MSSGHRRRIDRIMEPAYLADISGVDTAELRARLRECQEVESELSFQRRLLHGKLDIMRAELEQRRDSGRSAPSRDLLGRLSAILADRPRGKPGPRRGARPRLPRDVAKEARRGIDRLLSEAHLARLPDLLSQDLERLVDRLASEEEAVSSQRRALFERIDVIQEELVARYKDGRASPSDLLRPS